MMNLLQRSLRSDAANSNPSTTKVKSTGVMGGLHNSASLSVGPSSGYSTNDHYFKSYDPYFTNNNFFTSSSLPAAFPLNRFNTAHSSNHSRSDICQMKHIHYPHHKHSQSHHTSSMSNYLDNYANYGKLFPLTALQYLHQHNHIEEIIAAQQFLAKSDTKSNCKKNNRLVTLNYGDKVSDCYDKSMKVNFSREFETPVKNTYDKKRDEKNDPYTIPIISNPFGSISATHCPLNYEKNILGHQNSTNDYYRFSFLETHIYRPQDLNSSSPQHIPHHRESNQQFMHNEWIKKNLENLRNYFKPTFNEILVNVEKKAKYPFIVFGNPGPKFNTTNGIIDQDPFLIMPTASSINLSHELCITDGLFEVRDYVANSGYLIESYRDIKTAQKSPLGYIISTYQTFPGEDNEKLEETWFNWTGASYLSNKLPSNIGLGKLLFFKRRDLFLLKSDCLKQFIDNELPIFTYVLLCELFNLKEMHLPTTCAIIDQLRARCCGYTALYINCT